MTAVLTYLCGRPWLAPCIMAVAIGLSILASSRLGYLLFWAGILAITGGLLGILAGELGRKRERADRAGDRNHPRAG